MKKPNLKSLKINIAETKHIRENMSQKKGVKITINIDSEILAKLRKTAAKTGVPYQRLINRTLAESLNGRISSDSRLERLEKEINLLKRKIAA